jgi:hypothetical protein
MNSVEAAICLRACFTLSRNKSSLNQQQITVVQGQSYDIMGKAKGEIDFLFPFPFFLNVFKNDDASGLDIAKGRRQRAFMQKGKA